MPIMRAQGGKIGAVLPPDVVGEVVKTEVQLEAIRIWQTVPGKQWREELAKLPESRVICGVTWPYRESVRERLKAAWMLWKVGSVVAMPGMTAELKCAVNASSERGNGDAATGDGAKVCPAQEAGHKD